MHLVTFVCPSICQCSHAKTVAVQTRELKETNTQTDKCYQIYYFSASVKLPVDNNIVLRSLEKEVAIEDMF